jgi:hypothetical protein
MSWPIKVIITRFLPPRSSWPIKLQVHYERVVRREGWKQNGKGGATRRPLFVSFGGKRCKPLPFPFVSFSPSLIEVAMASPEAGHAGLITCPLFRGRDRK